jgi:hypothetical protein
MDRYYYINPSSSLLSVKLPSHYLCPPVQTLHDVFDLAEVADSLRAIKPGSKQTEILLTMLKHVCNCGDFIQSYAKDTQFCTSSPLNYLQLKFTFDIPRRVRTLSG